MRTSGVLMHVSSLPGEFGIGTFGKSAYSFVDKLCENGQTYWQILPLCPTSFGDSPYQSFCTFAGNPYFIDLDLLAERGYLKDEDYKSIVWADDMTRVDYARVHYHRQQVFSRMQGRFFENLPKDYKDFCIENAFWLDDFSLFMALKDLYGGRSFLEWDSDICKRESRALEFYRNMCSERINYYKMLQYLFFEQWSALKAYANKKGIKIIGDLPIYVALDSADVWANPEQFQLGADMRPTAVAGCPPDVFSEDGQLWGNPLYRWDYMKAQGYSWWILRIRKSLEMYDTIRIDHFRGFDSYYSIPAESDSAKCGEWKKGPGMDLFTAVKKALGEALIIAEDLGFLTESVHKLLKDSGFPGMKVLQFAFSPDSESDYLPHNHVKNCVVYTGTHDNDTLLGWCESASEGEREFAKSYLNSAQPLNWAMICSALSSVADTAIIPMQDIIGLGSAARMNAPSTVGTNWQWRARDFEINCEGFEKLCYYTKLYSRDGKEQE